MALSDLLLKSLPKFETTIPSLKTKVWFRPLLVREEKKLLQIGEFGSEKEKINCILEILESCYVYDKIRELTICDIQYLFIQLRIKSIGSMVSPILICPITSEKIKLHINLSEVAVIDSPNHSTNINLNGIRLVMKYPTIQTILDNFDSENKEDDIYNLALSCIKEIHTTDEMIVCSTQPIKELEDFLDNMTKGQFDNIIFFFESMPKIEKTITYTTSDEILRSITIKGISDFFV